MRQAFTNISGKLKWLEEILPTLPETADRSDRTCIPDCPLCDGYGNVIDGTAAGKCPNQLHKVYLERFEKEMADWDGWKNITTFQQAKAEPKFRMTESFRACESMLHEVFTSKVYRGLLLYGGHGRSKTEGPLTLLKKCAVDGIRCVAIKFPVLIDLYKAGDRREAIEVIYKRIEASTLVFVDEIGREGEYGNPEHKRVALQQIVGMCFRKKHLIMSSNFSKQELKMYLPSDIASRLSPDTGYCIHVEEPFGKEYDLRQQTNLFQG